MTHNFTPAPPYFDTDYVDFIGGDQLLSERKNLAKSNRDPISSIRKNGTKIVCIRHGPKAWSNGQTGVRYPHDPPILNSESFQTKDLAKTLIKSRLQPDIIYTSPFDRTRTTAQSLRKELNLLGVEVDIFVDSSMGEYLGHHVDKVTNKTLTPETMMYDVIVDNNVPAFTQRVRTGFENICESHPGKVVWVITHSFVIRVISQLYPTPITTVSSLGVTCFDSNVWSLQGEYWIKKSKR